MSRIRTPWRSVSAAFALNGVLLGCWASRVPTFVDRLALSEGMLGVLLLLMGVGALISFPLAGSLSDRHGAVRVTRWTGAVYLLSVVAVGFAPSVGFLGLALFLFGVFHGSMDVAMNSWATEVEKHMGRSVMSSFHAMWSLGAGLGAGGGYLATSIGAGTGPHFLIAAVVAGMVFWPFLQAPWTSRIRQTPVKAPIFAFPHGALILVGFMALAAGLGEGAAADWSAVYLRDVLGRPESQATLGYAAFSVTMVIMRLSVDRIITRFGPQAVARVAGVLAASGFFLCVLTDALPVALIGFVLMGMGYAAVIPMAFSRAAHDPEVPAGQAIASVATLGYGAMLLGPPAIGFIAEATSLRLSFVMVGGLALLIAAFAPALGRSRVLAAG
ncbi:MFS transporter [Antarctobacter jejuensis]|uniref:MFS transporter n=1 Tax=Antarctobacter jejuensis TaxID=1439938 RepID=UPI003FD09741